MEMTYLDGGLDELHKLPIREKPAMANALDKLTELGLELSYPRSSQVKGSTFRELRPRQGRSPWRALYQRVGSCMVIAAIAPEAQSDDRGFERAIITATRRLTSYREEQR